MLSLRTGSQNCPSLPPPHLGSSSFRGYLSLAGGSWLLSEWRVVQSDAYPLPLASGRRNEEVNCMRNVPAIGHQGFAPGGSSGKSRQSKWRS
jgi:hypothetical protein